MVIGIQRQTSIENEPMTLTINQLQYARVRYYHTSLYIYYVSLVFFFFFFFLRVCVFGEEYEVLLLIMICVDAGGGYVCDEHKEHG